MDYRLPFSLCKECADGDGKICEDVEGIGEHGKKLAEGGCSDVFPFADCGDCAHDEKTKIAAYHRGDYALQNGEQTVAVNKAQNGVDNVGIACHRNDNKGGKVSR